MIHRVVVLAVIKLLNQLGRILPVSLEDAESELLDLHGRRRIFRPAELAPDVFAGLG